MPIKCTTRLDKLRTLSIPKYSVGLTIDWMLAHRRASEKFNSLAPNLFQYFCFWEKKNQNNSKIVLQKYFNDLRLKIPKRSSLSCLTYIKFSGNIDPNLQARWTLNAMSFAFHAKIKVQIPTRPRAKCCIWTVRCANARNWWVVQTLFRLHFA